MVGSFPVSFSPHGPTSLNECSHFLGWRPSLVGWRPSLLGWRPLLLGGRPLLLGWRPSLKTCSHFLDLRCRTCVPCHFPAQQRPAQKMPRAWRLRRAPSLGLFCFHLHQRLAVCLYTMCSFSGRCPGYAHDRSCLTERFQWHREGTNRW